MYMGRIFGYNTQYSGGERTRVSRSAVRGGYDVSYDILKFTKSKIANLRYTTLQSAIMSYHSHTVMVLWYSAGRIKQYLTVLQHNSGPSVYYIIYRYSCRKRAVQLFYLGVSSHNISPLQILYQNQHTAARRYYCVIITIILYAYLHNNIIICIRYL